MTRPKVTNLTARLSERDWQILSTVRGFRFLTTRQLARQHFAHSPNGPIPRNVNHALARLRDLGLLEHLQRRIGGVRAGSGGYVWQVTDLGQRLVREHLGEEPGVRTRTFEPTTTFLDHTLAIAEVVITLREATRSDRVALQRVQLEPDCWRSYGGIGGEAKWLKPDLAVVTAVGGFEDHWFLEVDRATEPPNRIIKKCLQYEEYRRTDREQSEHGLFPAVAWVVPTQRRCAQLRRHLAQETAIDQRIFVVLAADELAALTEMGVSEFQKKLRDPPKGPSL